jgi:glycosyltransferase involved in cell wall biosynthesis
MKIALLTDGLWPLSIGGMQKHSFNLLKGLLNSGVEVLLYHPSKDSILSHIPEVLQSGLEEVLIPFPQTSAFPGSYLKASYLYSTSIADDLNGREDIQFIYAQGFTAWRLCDLKSKGNSTAPIGVNFHGLEMFQYTKGFKHRLIQWMFKGPVKFNLQNADVVYSLGGKLTDILKHFVPEEKISIIPIAVDKEIILADPAEKSHKAGRTEVLFIGRYERRKGVVEFNKAISDLEDRSDIGFQFIGPIPMSKRSSSSKAVYHGAISQEKDLLAIVDTCDVLCVPSLSEGMPTVILEAMARGLAIIASDVGAVQEQVDASNGYLISAGDHPQITAAITEYAGTTQEERSELSLNSIQRVMRDYIWERVIEQTLTDIETRFTAPRK